MIYKWKACRSNVKTIFSLEMADCGVISSSSGDEDDVPIRVQAPAAATAPANVALGGTVCVGIYGKSYICINRSLT
jgi:hypothetical protein